MTSASAKSSGSESKSNMPPELSHEQRVRRKILDELPDVISQSPAKPFVSYIYIPSLKTDSKEFAFRMLDILESEGRIELRRLDDDDRAVCLTPHGQRSLEDPEANWQARSVQMKGTQINVNQIRGLEELVRTMYSGQSSSSTILPMEIERFPETIRSRVPDCDVVVIRFVEEALRCFRADALLGCAFMTGAASERAIDLLMQAFGECISDATNRSKYFSKINNRGISKQFEEFSACYRGCKSRPNDVLSRDLDVILGSMFQFCRITRNDVGHPQIVPDLDKGVLLANLAHFVTYIERIYSLINHFKATGVVL
jgi:hypothetical protein